MPSNLAISPVSFPPTQLSPNRSSPPVVHSLIVARAERSKNSEYVRTWSAPRLSRFLRSEAMSSLLPTSAPFAQSKRQRTGLERG